jgi:hypothetical protein
MQQIKRLFIGLQACISVAGFRFYKYNEWKMFLDDSRRKRYDLIIAFPFLTTSQITGG